MRHRYECPIRWADLDALGHVNNVTYVDYLQEARVAMFGRWATFGPDGSPVDGLVVARTDITYRVPLLFGPDPVVVETWVSEVRAASFTLAYEVFAEAADGTRTTYCEATTLLTPFVFAEERPRRLSAAEKAFLEQHREDGPVPPRPERTPGRDVPGGAYPVHVRFSDVDVYGHVNNVLYLEYFQEARLQLLTHVVLRPIGAQEGSDAMVVARVEVDYRTPLLHRQEPYAARTWVSRVGRTSAVLESDIRDPETGTVHATARVVLVFVDLSTGRPQEPHPEAAARLRAMLPADGS